MSSEPIQPVGKSKARLNSFLLMLALVGGALSVLCHQAFKSHYVMWDNDNALGAFVEDSSRLPSAFTGHWVDEYWIGGELPASSPTVDAAMLTVLSPEMFVKVFAPVTMLLMGFCAWVMFRELKFAPLVCVVGALAAGLNMHCFSNACWGLGTWNLAIGMIFLTVAVMVSDSIRQTWMKAVLAGMTVGMAVMEGFDVGAILSVFAGVFVAFYCWVSNARPMGERMLKTSWVMIVVVASAVLLSASTVKTLVGTQIKDIAGAGQSAEEKSAQWDWATMWSLPKLETLRLITPGLFGYRLESYDTTQDKAGVYTGRVGEDPVLTALRSSDAQVRAQAAKDIGLPDDVVQAMRGEDAATRATIVDEIARQTGRQRRHTGSGEYAGVLTGLLALIALASSARRANNPYSLLERRMVWFFGLAALFALVAAWGRFSFLYGWLYYLVPYFSTIRNPIKFLHPFHLIWIILAGYGLEALYRNYMQKAPDVSAVSRKAAENKSVRFEMGWIGGLALVSVVAIGAFLILGSGDTSESKKLMTRYATYLRFQGFSDEAAPRMTLFAFSEAKWCVVYLVLSCVTIISILAGLCRGSKAFVAWALLCGIMIFDLGRTDAPWVRYYNVEQKYSMNPVVDFLRKDPYEHRVAAKLVPNQSFYPLEPGQFGILGGVCHWWLENDFPYNNIQSIDLDQMSRPPVPETKIFSTMSPLLARDLTQSDLTPAVRLWKMANARYLLAPAAIVPILNDRGDPIHRGFQTRLLFNLVIKPGLNQTEDAGDITAEVTKDGPFAVVELTNALPRARLYSHWEKATDDEALAKLKSEQFDLWQTVLIGDETPAPAPPANTTNADDDAGDVTITLYKPKDVLLTANAKTPAVLLLNDRTAPKWNVWVDDKPAPVLRCNYIMRGVYLTTGPHKVEFRFQPSLLALGITSVTLLGGIAILGYLAFTCCGKKQFPDPKKA